MIQPTQDDIGRKVVYREHGDFPGRKIEEGVLTSFNEKYAFVRYVGVTSAATDFADLEWISN
ncbi:MAG TPA: hypothetical protein VGM38_09445 [Pseudolysinimonas sp.]|jgi:hypothetical protein